MAETGNVGYGQQDPNSAASDFNKIAFMVRQMTALMETMRLVQVVGVTGGGGAIAPAGTVDVLPLVNQMDGSGNATKHGTVFGVPWFRLQGGQNAVVIDPQVGDIGFVDVSNRDISIVKKTKAQSNPGSLRRFNLADGVYVGGCLCVAPTQYLAFTSTGVRLVDANGNSVAMSTAGLTLTDSNGNVLSMDSSGIEITGNVRVNGNLHATGTISAEDVISSTANIIAGNGTGDLVTLQLHTHTGNNIPPTPGH